MSMHAPVLAPVEETWNDTDAPGDAGVTVAGETLTSGDAAVLSPCAVPFDVALDVKQVDTARDTGAT